MKVVYGLDAGIPRMGIPHESFSRPGMYVGLRVKFVLIDFDRTGTVLNEFYKNPLNTVFLSQLVPHSYPVPQWIVGHVV